MINKLLHLPRYLAFFEWHPHVRVQSIRFRRATRGVVCEIWYGTGNHKQFSWTFRTTKLKSYGTVLGALILAYRQMLIEAREHRSFSNEFSYEDRRLEI